MVIFGINMNNKNIENFSILAQYANELAKDSGVPGISLIGHFSQVFYNKYLASRFEKFAKDAEIDERMLNDILENENYSNYLYSALETVRRTHSKLGLIALALLYKDYWNNADILISAMRAFAEISNKQILSFVELYESIPEGKNEVKIEEYNKYIKNYISNNDENKEFYLKFTKITLYDSNGLIILNKSFPLIIQTLNELPKEENENNLNLIKLIIPKINIYDKIKQFYEKLDNSIKIIDIETFKEKKFSLITQSLFTYQKKIIIKLSPISFKILKKIIDLTKKELNPFLKTINPQYSINHIVILPSKNENFSLLNNTKKVILLLDFQNVCITFMTF